MRSPINQHPRDSRRLLASDRRGELIATLTVGILTGCSGPSGAFFTPPDTGGAPGRETAHGGNASADPDHAGGAQGTPYEPQGEANQPNHAGGGAEAGAPQAPAGASNAGGAAGTIANAAGGGALDPRGEQGSLAEAGAAGSAAEEPTCADEVVLVSPMVATFDDYDPAANVFDARFAFNSVGKSITGGITPYTDGSGTYAVNLVPDGRGGRALQVSNPSASAWGGGAKVALHCIDAGRFSGLTFRIRGVTPRGTVELALTIESGEYVGSELSIPPTWTQMKVPFSALHGVGSSPASTTTSGASITEITFSSQLNYSASGIAIAGAFEIAVDDLGFY